MKETSDIETFQTINTGQKLMLESAPLLLFFKYATPSIIVMLISTTAYIVDGWFIGNFINAEALAAVSVIMPIFSLLFGISLMFSSGGVVQYAKYIGEDNRPAAFAVFTKIMMLQIVLAIIISTVGFVFGKQIIRFLGATDAVYDYAIAYYNYVIFFSLSFILAGELAGFLRAEGHIKIGLIASITSVVLNVVLDYVFIVHTDMGMKGPALATGIAGTSAVLVYIVFIVRNSDGIRFVKNIGKWKELLSMAHNGMSETIGGISSGIMLLIFNRILIWAFGSDGVSSFAITQYFIVIVMTIAFAISDGLNAVISTNNGAMRILRTRKILFIEIVSIGTVSITLFLFASFASDDLIGFFIRDASESLLSLSATMLFYQRWAILLVGVNIIITAYLTSLQHAKLSGLLASLRSLIFPVVFGVMLGIMLGAKAIYIVFPISETLGLLTAIAMLLFVFSRQNKHLH